MAFREPVKSQNRSASTPYTFTPPVRGWITNEPLPSGKPGGARVLENWFPTRTSARVRKGSAKYATISSGPVTRMWTYRSGSVEKFFAADATKIFDITTVADKNTIPTAVVTGQTSGDYSTCQFGTAGGDFLSICNGANTPKYFDGTTWANHAFTGLGTPQNLSFVWSFSSRLFFVLKDTMKCYYLPVDSINGALNEFSLAGIFQEGGSLVMGGVWSVDAGLGLNQNCVFISSTGEVAVYQGTNPGGSNTWSKVGVYKITPPIGKNATMQAGGELLIATREGLVPISEAVHKDVAALNLSAVSKNIESEWKTEANARTSIGWEIMKWPSNNMMVVSLPVTGTNVAAGCFVANLETGAWCKFTNWETRSLCHFDSKGFFGTNTGKVYQMESSGADDGVPYVCTYVGLPDHVGAKGVTKVFHSARASFLSGTPFNTRISASMNYEINLPTAPSSAANLSSDVWDVGLWDVAKWDAGTVKQITTRWVSIGRSGFSYMPQVQITCGATIAPVTELVAMDVLYENAGVMV